MSKSKLKATQLTIIDDNNSEYIVHEFEKQGLVVKTKEQLKSAISKLSSSEGTIIVVDNIIIDEDITVPENVMLKFVKGGKLNIQSGYTLTLDCHIEAGLFHIFDGDGTISGDPKTEAVYPKWFGAVGDGITDDTQAIQKAIDISNNITITKGTYKITDTISLSGKNLITQNATFVYTGDAICFLFGNSKNIKIEFVKSTIDLTSAGDNAIGIEIRGMWNSLIVNPTVYGKGGTNNQIGINIKSTYLNDSGYYGFFTTTILTPTIKNCNIGIQLLGISDSQMVTHCVIQNGWLNNQYRDIKGQYIANSLFSNIACDSYDKVLYHMEFETIIGSAIISGEFGTVLSGGADIKASGNCAGTFVTGDRVTVDNSGATAVINRRTNNAIELQATNTSGYRAILATNYEHNNPFSIYVSRDTNTNLLSLLNWTGDSLNMCNNKLNIEYGNTTKLKVVSSSNANYAGGIKAQYSYNNQFAIYVLNADNGTERNAIIFGNTKTALLDGDIFIPNLPTSDPRVVGKLWVDTTNGNVLKVSQG